MEITTAEVTPEHWPDLEKLFGAKGACGGCWCMSWRIQKGEKWADIKGQPAKERFRALVKSGQAHGVLAYVGKEPVGWCAFNRRKDFAKLDRSRSLACADADAVWSLPCFYIKTGFRGQGVATALLRTALAALERRGAAIAEGYPAKNYKPGEKIPAAFAWTGTRSLFAKAGFTLAGPETGAKQRMRRKLGKKEGNHGV